MACNPPRLAGQRSAGRGRRAASKHDRERSTGPRHAINLAATYADRFTAPAGADRRADTVTGASGDTVTGARGDTLTGFNGRWRQR